MTAFVGQYVEKPGVVGATPAMVNTCVGGADVAQVTCSVDGCGKPFLARGWCAMHWSRWRRYGDLDRGRLSGPSVCIVEGCGRRPKARGLCSSHDRRARGEVASCRPVRVFGLRCPCGKPAKGAGLCHGHYLRWFKTGDARVSQPIRDPDPQARFWSRVEKTDGCWTWKGATSKGYGVARHVGRSRLAHRVAYEWLVGPIPDGLTLDHLCDNPPCVNPAHLEPVTNAENIRRAWARKRAVGAA